MTQKRKIMESRVSISEKISSAVVLAHKKPMQVIQASAVGYYGYDISDTCDESSSKGLGFLADVCETWEHALKLDNDVIKTIIRFGIVLGSE